MSATDLAHADDDDDDDDNDDDDDCHDVTMSFTLCT